MELLRKNIHMIKNRCEANVQMTLDDDFNVPDVKPDIAQIVKTQGKVIIKDYKVTGGKVVISGNLTFNMLYLSENHETPLHSIRGELPFEETANMDRMCAEDTLFIHANIEDLSAGMINSRKINLRSIITFELLAEQIYDENAVTQAAPEEQLCVRQKEVELTELVFSKKDSLRIKDEIRLGAGKPNIEEIIYEEMMPGESKIRIQDEMLDISGEIHLCIMYLPQQESGVCHMEKTISYHEQIPVNRINEGMIPDVVIYPGTQNVSVHQDEDGEERMIEWEGTLELDIHIYGESKAEIMEDVYSVRRIVTPEYVPAMLKHLRMKNVSKLRMSENLTMMQPQEEISQVLLPLGVVTIDDTTIVENGIELEGALNVSALFISAQEERPFGVIQGAVPWRHRIEVQGIRKEHQYRIVPAVVQLDFVPINASEIEVRAMVNFDTTVFEIKENPVIADIKEEEGIEELRESLPGMIGYIVKKGESLWDIAKKYLTTIDEIMEVNQLNTDEVEEGDRIVITTGEKILCSEGVWKN